MDNKKIKQLAAMMKQEGVVEFELKEGEHFIRIKRESSNINMPPIQAAPAQPVSISSGSERKVEVAEETKEGPASGNQHVVSPIVGTFYRAPSPKADPYVKVGDKVQKGQVLCILEAMKLMNELEAEYPCEIVKILVNNAQPVEYAEPLFEVKPL
ncbi:acetyl-CoA carboxylase biotin carboxyl carrier protein [bacterium]|nr:acetyl-CoA carboxylase biotin carboxyl carrier protein [candidate division CSSED10-310 bacterium]